MAQLVVSYSRLNGSALRGETQSWSTEESTETNWQPNCLAVTSPQDEHCYYDHSIEWANSNVGFDHVPTRGSLVYGFCNTLVSGQEKGVEEENPSRTGHGVQVTTFTDCHEKTRTSYFTGAKRTRELQDPLSHHHMTAIEGVHVPLGDISKVEG